MANFRFRAMNIQADPRTSFNIRKLKSAKENLQRCKYIKGMHKSIERATKSQFEQLKQN